MMRWVDPAKHAASCRCPRCYRLARLRAARCAIAIAGLGFVFALLLAAALIGRLLS